MIRHFPMKGIAIALLSTVVVFALLACTERRVSQVSQDCPEIRVTPANLALRERPAIRVRQVCLETPVTQGLRVLPAHRARKALQGWTAFRPKLPSWSARTLWRRQVIRLRSGVPDSYQESRSP